MSAQNVNYIKLLGIVVGRYFVGLAGLLEKGHAWVINFSGKIFEVTE